MRARDMEGSGTVEHEREQVCQLDVALAGAWPANSACGRLDPRCTSGRSERGALPGGPRLAPS